MASERRHPHSECDWLELFHRSFNDYCYARFFVERGGRLAEAILLGDQGLFARRLLVQVLTYLRGSDTRAYLRELQELLRTEGLRFHLHDLLIRWFGALSDPTSDELLIARRRLIDAHQSIRTVESIEWQSCLVRSSHRRSRPGDAAYDDQVLDIDIIPFLNSMVDSAQSQTIKLVRPFLGLSSAWDARLASVVSSIRAWHTPDAVELFEQVCLRQPGFALEHSYDLSCITIAYPKVGCRLIRLALDLVLASTWRRTQTTLGSITWACRRLLDSLNNGYFGEALATASQSEPEQFVESLLPWLESVTFAGSAD